MRTWATCALAATLAACIDPKLDGEETVSSDDTRAADTAAPEDTDTSSGEDTDKRKDSDGGIEVVVERPEEEDGDSDDEDGDSEATDDGDDLGLSCPPVLDFDWDAAGYAIAAGADLSDVYRAYGVSITASAGGSGMRLIGFDSASPTGGDADLGTPNADFGGAGVGSGGGLGEIGENAEDLGGVLIIAEDTDDADGDGLVDDPDDNAGGGVVTLTFDEAMCVNRLTLLDIESAEHGTITMWDADGLVLEAHAAAGLGNNSVEALVLGGLCGVHSVTVALSSSGGIDEVDICPESVAP